MCMGTPPTGLCVSVPQQWPFWLAGSQVVAVERCSAFVPQSDSLVHVKSHDAEPGNSQMLNLEAN